MGNLKGKYCIVGVGETPFTRGSGRTTRAMGAEAIRHAMDDAGLNSQQVDGILRYHGGDSTPATSIMYDLGIRPNFYMDCSGGGSSTEALVGLAMGAIEAGMCDTVAIFRSMNGYSQIRIGGTGVRAASAITGPDLMRRPYGLISAVHGAAAIQSTGLPLPLVLGLMVLFTGLLNLFVGSASAKWALLAPILVPMLMLLGISPEGATAAYRVGDSATNIITPLMVYFPLILVFAQRWQKDFGLGSLTAMMIPYSVWLLISGTVLIVLWFYLGIPLGPDAPVSYMLPEVAAPTAPLMN